MEVEVLIIGLGVVGLACAARIAAAGFSTLCIERHASFGQETSSRNSEVIHSGIYYPAGSLKARLCVAGNRNLYPLCERLGVWHRRCGKLVVAVTEEEETDLDRLLDQARMNGVAGVEKLSAAAVRNLEPEIHCLSALIVTSSGIVDSHELMKAYLHEATSHGATIAFGVEFLGPVPGSAAGYVVRLRDANREETEVTARHIINSAGLQATAVAGSFGIDVSTAGYRMYPNRGHYYRVSPAKSRLVSRLVYPIPPKNMPGLGIHITIDRAGQCKLGPDAEYIGPSVPEELWYAFDDTRREKFQRAVSRYFPCLEVEDLSPDQVGVRCKLQAPGERVRDFVIAEETGRGLPRLINLVGIESPGLTCSWEIAGRVLELMKNGGGS